MKRALLPLLMTLALGGCDYLGIQSAAQVAEQVDADGKAIGGACRHALRAIEDCYKLNPKASKAAVYNGWRDMDTYMRENNLVGIVPAPPPPPPPKPPAEDGEEVVNDKSSEGKAAAKH